MASNNAAQSDDPSVAADLNVAGGITSSNDVESRWRETRETSTIPSEPSTPAATPQITDDPFGRGIPASSRSMSRRSSLAAAPPAPSRAMNIDAEDEDVKIAIMALGAMKHLDGKSRSRSESQSGRETAKTSTSSGLSTSSVNSTAISSPASSTPATELTQSTYPSTSSPSQSLLTRELSRSTSSSSSTPATLADLPPNFQFPAIVHDENGNEMRVDLEDMTDDDFLKRVSHLPIVRGTLKAYELGKQRNRIVKYGGDLVESSVKAISRPVVSRLGARLGERGVEQLDDFACRQLDRIYPSTDRSPSKEEKQMITQELDEKERTDWKDMSEEERSKRRKAYWALRYEEKEREIMIAEMKKRDEAKESGLARGSTSDSQGSSSSSAAHSRRSTASDHVVSNSAPMQALVRQQGELQAAKGSNGTGAMGGSGWSSMLVEAGVTAGGLSAAMSEESMKSLKYCLQWLQYATAHIEHQITILRDLIVKLNHGELDLSSPASQHLAVIKGDVVNTIRGVVDVVGKYAGGALPEPARNSVKAFILSLPARWAKVNRAPGSLESGGGQGSFGGSPASPSFSSAHMSDSSRPSTSNHSSSASVARQQAAATAVAANKVLTLAVESLDILRSVTVVFGESLDRADLWVERLRVLGLQRKRAHEQAAAEEAAARIDMGMGGALARGNWETARGLKGSDPYSPSQESDLSMSTSASTTKRRRTKRRGTGASSSTNKSRGSPSPKPAQDTDDELVSDEGSSTETERASLAGKSAGMTPNVPFTSHHQPHHQYSGGTAHRRNKGKIGGRVSAARTTSSTSSTPMLQELSLQDPDSTSAGAARR